MSRKGVISNYQFGRRDLNWGLFVLFYITFFFELPIELTKQKFFQAWLEADKNQCDRSFPFSLTQISYCEKACDITVNKHNLKRSSTWGQLLVCSLLHWVCDKDTLVQFTHLSVMIAPSSYRLLSGLNGSV